MVVVLSMGGGIWFVLRRVLHRVPAGIELFGGDRDPTTGALRRGAEAALQEFGGRAGRFNLFIVDPASRDRSRLWIGTSDGILRNGDQLPAPFVITAVDTHPAEPAGWLRVTPGCLQQGAAAARWVKSQNLTRVFLLRDPLSIRSKLIADSFQKTAAELGLTIDGPADPTEEWNGLPERIVGSRTQAVFYSGEEAPYLTGYRVFSALRELKFSGPLAQAEADPEVSFLATRPALVEGSYLLSPFAPGPHTGPHVNAGYFAMKAMLEAIDRANSLNPDELRRAAAKLPYFDAQGRAALRKCALYVAKDGVYDFVRTLD